MVSGFVGSVGRFSFGCGLGGALVLVGSGLGLWFTCVLLVGLLVVVVGFNLGGGRGWGFWGLGFRFGFKWFMGRFVLYGLVDCGWIGFSIGF